MIRQVFSIGILVVLTTVSFHSYGQDIIEGRVLEQFISTSPKLDSLVSAFVSSQASCIKSGKHTVVAISYKDSVKGDTNAITIEVVHFRDLQYGEVRGFLNYDTTVVFLFTGVERLNLVINTHRLKEFLISQKITYGNYLVQDNDTLVLSGPPPYKARWTLFYLNGRILESLAINYPCDIENEVRSINELINVGWRYP